MTTTPAPTDKLDAAAQRRGERTRGRHARSLASGSYGAPPSDLNGLLEPDALKGACPVPRRPRAQQCAGCHPQLRQRGVPAGEHNCSAEAKREPPEASACACVVGVDNGGMRIVYVAVCSIACDELTAFLASASKLLGHAAQPAPGLWNGRFGGFCLISPAMRRRQLWKSSLATARRPGFTLLGTPGVAAVSR